MVFFNESFRKTLEKKFGCGIFYGIQDPRKATPSKKLILTGR
jgi:hypothetical protein